MTVSLPVIPNSVSIGAEIDMTWSTVVNVSEGGIAGRESLHSLPLRQFHMTIGPDDAAEVKAIFAACYGQRYPAAVRDWSDYTFTDEVLAWSIVGGATHVQLSKKYTPATGNRAGLTQTILYPDQSSVNLSFKINSSTYGGSFTVLDYGVVSLATVVSTGAVVTGSGQYLVPVCFMQDMLTTRMVTKDIATIQDVQMREIFYQELVNLLS